MSVPVAVEVERELSGFIGSELNKPGVDPGTPLVSSGLVDSLGLVKISTFLEARYGVNLLETGSPDDFESIASLAAAVASLAPEAPAPTGITPGSSQASAMSEGAHDPAAPIVAFLRRGNPAIPPLFCIFGVQLYQELAHALGTDRSVVAMHAPFLHVPGRDRTPTIEEMGRRYLDLVQKHQPHGPYHLLGLCFGGIVAWEIAAQFEDAGEVVESVTILDAVLPTAVRVDRWDQFVDRARRALRPDEMRNVLERWERRRVTRHPSSTEPVDVSVDGPEVDAEVARFAARQRTLTANVLVVRATAEPAPSWMAVARDQGWGGRARSVAVHDIPGTHLEILREPHVRSLADAVNALVAGASRPAEAAGDAA